MAKARHRTPTTYLEKLRCVVPANTHLLDLSGGTSDLNIPAIHKELVLEHRKVRVVLQHLLQESPKLHAEVVGKYRIALRNLEAAFGELAALQQPTRTTQWRGLVPDVRDRGRDRDRDTDAWMPRALDASAETAEAFVLYNADAFVVVANESEAVLAAGLKQVNAIRASPDFKSSALNYVDLWAKEECLQFQKKCIATQARVLKR